MQGHRCFNPGNAYAGSRRSESMGSLRGAFRNNCRWLDFLKVRAQAGVLGYDSSERRVSTKTTIRKSNGINFGPYTTNYQWLAP